MNKQRRAALNALQDRLQRTGITDALDELRTICDELGALKDQEEEAVENTPESMQDRDSLDALESAFDQLSDLLDGFDTDLLDEVFSKIEDAKGAA